MSEIVIRKVETLADLQLVYRLTHESFYTAGLCEKQPQEMIIHHPNQDVIPQTQVYVAELEGRPVGSISFTIDSEYKMMVDPEFNLQVNKYRKFYGKAATVWRFIVLPEFQGDTRIFRHLISLASKWLLKNQVPVCFFTFSPEHARIYNKVFNMEEICRGRDSNPAINDENAEVVLMKLYPDKLPDKWFTFVDDEVLN